MEIQFVFLGSKIQRFSSQEISLFYVWGASVEDSRFI